MDKKVALIDLDHCLVDWDAGVIPELKALECDEEKGKYNYDGNLWDIEKMPGIRPRLNLIMSKQGWWMNLKPIESGLQLYNYIKNRFDTYILTKARKDCSLAWKEKVDWIHKYLGYNVNIMVVTEKKLVMGDLLFDDYYNNGVNWLVNNPNGRVLVPKRKSNKTEELNNKDERIVFWDDSSRLNPIFAEIYYDFRVPHKLIEEILSQ